MQLHIILRQVVIGGLRVAGGENLYYTIILSLKKLVPHPLSLNPKPLSALSILISCQGWATPVLICAFI